MKNNHLSILFLILISTLVITSSYAQIEDTVETDSIEKVAPFTFNIGQTVLNKSLWQQPYRYQYKALKTLSVKITIIKNTGKNEALDFNDFTLLDESKKLRIRSTGVYYPKRDKKKYLKSKPVNENYDDFEDTTLDGYLNFQAETYKTNFLGIKKRNILPTVKLLKKITPKAKKTVYYLDFPVRDGFTYGKVLYKNKPVGFAAIKN